MHLFSVRLSSPFWRYVAMALDAVLVAASGVIAHWWHHGSIAENEPPLDRYSFLVLTATVILVLGFSRKIYRSRRNDSLISIVNTVTIAWLTCLALIVAWLYITKSSANVSRLWFGSWALITLGALVLARAFTFSVLHWLRSRGFNFKTVLIVGHGRISDDMQDAVKNTPWCGLRILTVVNPQELPSFLATQQRDPDEIWLCLDMGSRDALETALEALRHSTANIRMAPDWYSLKLINHGISEIAGMHMLDLSVSPLRGTTLIVKQMQDFALASLILIFISPVMLAIALAIKLTSPGPLLFKQKRHGWNGEEITVYKFRTMVVHQEVNGGVTQATRNDPRITALGAFLRKSSLDELPQFFNVLQGHMSIVGPRPHAVQHNEHYKQLVKGYMLRHKVKPGITGWAQINGLRGETDTLYKMEQRVKHDLFYIENVSLWFDIKIIFLTIFKVFAHPNAY